MNINIPKTALAPNLQISPIITGLWQIADMERGGKQLDYDAIVAELRRYALAGLTTFDMADHYGSAEIIAGKLRKSVAADSEVQLLTKWVPPPGKLTFADVEAAVLRAMERLDVECIDLLQFHAWQYCDPAWLDSLFWLQELKERGWIKHLGLTNFDATHLHMVLASGIKVISNQVSFSLIDQRAAGRLTEICRRYNVKLLAYGTLCGGFLSEKWLNQPDPGLHDRMSWSQMKYKRFIDAAGGWSAFQQLLQTVHGIAQKHRCSIANVAEKYILDQPAVAAIIVGARPGISDHLQNNLDTLALQLDEEDRAQIATALSQLAPIPGDCGDEYRKPPYLTASGDLSHHIESFPPAYQLGKNASGRDSIYSGTPWEKFAGYCRAVKRGNMIFVSGTTATHGDRLIGGDDPAAQLHFIIDKIEGVLKTFGANLQDVVRTRLFVKRISDWEPIARAHGLRFQGIDPANTLVQADLVGEKYLVEMEANAIIGE
jgi:aryl-alcohol dehydrogenase-like predicted oxidoreductase/enamine deaminase RidA (YjgF/YER057c/UK114 family)